MRGGGSSKGLNLGGNSPDSICDSSDKSKHSDESARIPIPWSESDACSLGSSERVVARPLSEVAREGIESRVGGVVGTEVVAN